MHLSERARLTAFTTFLNALTCVWINGEGAVKIFFFFFLRGGGGGVGTIGLTRNLTKPLIIRYIHMVVLKKKHAFNLPLMYGHLLYSQSSHSPKKAAYEEDLTVNVYYDLEQKYCFENYQNLV